jgi:hypothetical protein
MAPEQAAGRSRAVGPAADVYALGAILYELLAGRPPFVGENAVEVILQVTRGDPPPPLRLAGARNARDLEAVVLRCLEKEPADRYRSAGAMADDLRCWLDGRETAARPLGRTSRLGRAARRNARGLGVGAAVLALAAAVAYLALKPGPAPTTAPPAAAGAEGEAFLEQVRAEVVREVTKARARPPRVIRAPHPSTTVEPTLTRQDYSAFEFLADRRVWDLRLWKPVPPGRRHEYLSAVCLTDRQRMKKLRPVDEYRSEVRTSGLAAFVESASHPRSFRVIAEREKVLVGGEEMKARQQVLDLRGVPVDEEFEVRTEATFWNNLQDDNDRWLGVIGYDGSFKVSMLFIFPPDRPIRDFQLLVAPTGNMMPRPYTGRKTLLVGPNRDYLYWDILEPQARHVYLVRWKW